MRRTWRTLLIALPLLLTVMGATKVARAEAKLKFGYVDLQRAIEETDEGAKAKAELRKIFEKKQQELSKQQEELKKAKEEYDRKRLLMTPEARAKSEQELQQKLVELQGALMQHQKELGQKEAEVMKKILQKMERILQELGRTQGYTMIFEKGEARLLWALPSMDLTNEVIRRYNEAK